eukprot:IDg17421t1
MIWSSSFFSSEVILSFVSRDFRLFRALIPSLPNSSLVLDGFLGKRCRYYCMQSVLVLYFCMNITGAKVPFEGKDRRLILYAPAVPVVLGVAGVASLSAWSSVARCVAGLIFVRCIPYSTLNLTKVLYRFLFICGGNSLAFNLIPWNFCSLRVFKWYRAVFGSITVHLATLHSISWRVAHFVALSNSWASWVVVRTPNCTSSENSTTGSVRSGGAFSVIVSVKVIMNILYRAGLIGEPCGTPRGIVPICFVPSPAVLVVRFSLLGLVSAWLSCVLRACPLVPCRVHIVGQELLLSALHVLWS